MSVSTSVFHDMVFVFLGGGVGAVSRWAISRLALRLTGGEFPWGTLGVNLVGCLLVGFIVGAIDFGILPARSRPLLVAGFLGGLTTFSSYAYGIFELARRGNWGQSLFQFSLENGLGLVLIFVGFRIAEGFRG